MEDVRLGDQQTASQETGEGESRPLCLLTSPCAADVKMARPRHRDDQRETETESTHSALMISYDYDTKENLTAHDCFLFIACCIDDFHFQ